VPDGGDRTVSPRSGAVGILTVIAAALGVAAVGWLLAIGMTLLVR